MGTDGDEKCPRTGLHLLCLEAGEEETGGGRLEESPEGRAWEAGTESISGSPMLWRGS